MEMRKKMKRMDNDWENYGRWCRCYYNTKMVVDRLAEVIESLGKKIESGASINFILDEVSRLQNGVEYLKEIVLFEKFLQKLEEEVNLKEVYQKMKEKEGSGKKAREKLNQLSRPVLEWDSFTSGGGRTIWHTREGASVKEAIESANASPSMPPHLYGVREVYYSYSPGDGWYGSTATHVRVTVKDIPIHSPDHEKWIREFKRKVALYYNHLL